MKSGLGFSLLLLALSAPIGAQAGTADVFNSINIVECQPHDEAQEAADWEVANKGFDLINAGNIAGLETLLPQLENALSHAPDRLPYPERCGNEIRLYASSKAAENLLILASAVAAQDKGMEPKESINLVNKKELPYGYLALMTGWAYFERGDFEKAADAYAKGMKNRVDITNLAGEYALILYKLGRVEEGLKIVNDFLEADYDIGDVEKGILLRKKGYGLVELKRWDEAKAAYEESLKYDDVQVAREELKYIKENRK